MPFGRGGNAKLPHLPRFSACVDVAEPIDDEQLVIDRNDRAADLRHGEIIAQSQAGYVERQKRRVDVLIERNRHRIAYVLPREKVPHFAVAGEQSAKAAVRSRFNSVRPDADCEGASRDGSKQKQGSE